jgi:membrane-bound lytic murein transglycosylase B
MKTYRNKLKQTIILGLILALVPAWVSFAQSTDSTVSTDQQTSDAQKAALQQQLDQIQQEILQYEHQLAGVQSQKNTLNNKLKALNVTKNKVTLEIQATSLNIQNITQQVSDTQSQIADAMQQIASLREKIRNLLPEIYDKDQQSTIEMLLNNDGLIGFYSELDAYEQINKNLGDLLANLDLESKQLVAEQNQLEDQNQQQQNLLSIQSLQNDNLKANITEQNTLLTQTKGQESAYQATLVDKRAAAAKIQSRLYELFGVGSGNQINFGQAVAIAKYVSGVTGVRAAFLLAILTQESNLGKNVGTCNRPGDPPSKSYKVIMKPDRDIPPFLQITADLGLDPNVTPVSCPGRVGWGGAMGPAQFIPSTWMGYKDQVAAITGKSANPWDIRDAFIAAGVKLKSQGGDSVSGEWAAAMRYFSGGTNLRFRFYGDNVVATANRYQADIDALNQ